MSSLYAGSIELHEQLVLSYVLLPGCGLLLLVTVHLVAALIAWSRGSIPLVNAADDRQLQREVTSRTKELEENLRTGNMKRSLCWDRRKLEAGPCL